MVELLAQHAALGRRQITLLMHQQLDEVAVAAIGRHAASRGVRLSDQARLFQGGHLVAHGGRRKLGFVFARDQIGGHRLRQGDVLLDNMAQDSLAAGGQFCHSGGLKNFSFSTLRAGVLSRRGRMILDRHRSTR